jgi:hypothetical protein
MSYGFNDLSQSDHEIHQNRTATAAKLAEVNADRSLHPDFKSAKLREVQDAGDLAHDKLLSARKQVVASEREKLYATAFQRGVYDKEKYRTLYTQADTAADAGAAELERLARQAANTSDSQLARAVSHVAFDRGMLSLLGDNPAVHELLDFEYQHTLRKAVGADARREQLANRLRESMLTTSPSRG